MRDLLMKFLGREISRREFGKGLAALGLSAPAVSALVSNAASAQLPPPAEGAVRPDSAVVDPRKQPPPKP